MSTRRGSPPPRRFSTSRSDSSGESGSSVRVLARSLPPPQPGRTSSSSGRAMQATRIGASRLRSVTWSTRSSRLGSAQWRSSSTTTSGRERDRPSKNRRTAQPISSGGRAMSPDAPMSCATRAATSAAEGSSGTSAAIASLMLPGPSRSSGPMASRTISASGQYVMPSPYERHRPRSTVGSRAKPSSASCTSRDFPTPGGPRIVNR